MLVGARQLREGQRLAGGRVDQGDGATCHLLVVTKAEDKLVKDEAREQQAHANGEASIRAYLDKVVK